ncbi:MAG: LytTR family transcriptional regulator DNA-binding domain-containing protein [Bacteroidota bacterium]
MDTNSHPAKTTSIIGSILELFRRPFPVMEDWTMRWLVIGFHGLFIAVFLIFLRPFPTIFSSDNLLIRAGYGVVVSLILAINHFLIHHILPIDIKKWTVGKSIIWTLHDIVSVTIWVFVYNNIWTNFQYFSWGQFFYVGWATLVLAIIPVMISTILLENWLLRRNLRNASRLQQSVDGAAAILTPDLPQKEVPFLTLHAENQSDWIKIRPANLIYLESADNYVNIFYKEKEKIQKKLLRSTLTNIEAQITTPHVQRCHRSYMLNLRQIKHVDGNSRGLQLQLLDLDKVIPVSRKYVKKILTQIEEDNS